MPPLVSDALSPRDYELQDYGFLLKLRIYRTRVPGIRGGDIFMAILWVAVSTGYRPLVPECTTMLVISSHPLLSAYPSQRAGRFPAQRGGGGGLRAQRRFSQDRWPCAALCRYLGGYRGCP